MIKYSNGDCPVPSRPVQTAFKKNLFFSLGQHPAAAAAAAAAGCKSPPFSTPPPPLLGRGIRQQQGIKNVYRKSPTEFRQFKFSTLFFSDFVRIPVRLFKLPQWRRCFLARSFAPRSNYIDVRYQHIFNFLF